jgi:putative radical SAM enzyme (TIGR03279 family)
VVAVEPGSAAENAGLAAGDEVMSISGVTPTDVIAWQLLVDEADPSLAVLRDGHEIAIDVPKDAGAPLGAEVNAAIFDRVQTCDNHCEFCFIYQLPPGLRRSLYLKDDDYRLSFLYGNFTTLTRFTELDLERVLDERLSPLYVSIHATDPDVRARMLRNRRGAISLRWLSALLDGGIEVHGQVVVCPGVNDGAVLADTLAGVLDRYPSLATLAVVPLGVSSHQREPAMRPHTAAEAAAVVGLCEDWQQRFLDVLGRRLVFAADEYYLLAGRPFPAAETYGDFPMHEDGIGMARAFEQEFRAVSERAPGGSIGQRAPAAGFFSWVDGAPAQGYRAVRAPGHGANRSGEIDAGGLPLSLGPERPPATAPTPVAVTLSASPRRDASAANRLPGDEPARLPVGILTGTYGAAVLAPLVSRWHADASSKRQGSAPRARVIEVPNSFFGGNIGVTGLLAGVDIAAALAAEPVAHRYLLPDVCLSGGKFLDGMTPAELPRPVEIVPTNGSALRALLDAAAGAQQ